MDTSNDIDIEQLESQYAGTLLVTESGEIIGHLHAGKAAGSLSENIGPFGGDLQSEDESPLHGALRELAEKTNLDVDPFELRLIAAIAGWQETTEEWQGCHIFYLTIPDDAVSGLDVYEGGDWSVITSPHDPRLAEGWGEFVQILEDKLGLR